MLLAERKMLPAKFKGLQETKGGESASKCVLVCKGDGRALILQGFVLASADQAAGITIPFFKTE